MSSQQPDQQSDQQPYQQPYQQPGQIILKGGLSQQIWDTLKHPDYWGSIAAEVQNLVPVKDVEGPFEHWEELPHEITERALSPSGLINNPRIHLAEIRYGVIRRIAVSKPSVWLIVRQSVNQGELQDQNDQIDLISQYMCWIMALSGEGSIRSLVSTLFGVFAQSITELNSEIYALLCVPGGNFEAGILEDGCGGMLGLGEDLVVQLLNGKPSGKYQSAVWRAKGH